jgi:hypothetical protein
LRLFVLSIKAIGQKENSYSNQALNDNLE